MSDASDNTGDNDDGSISNGIENYLEKIHCLVACMNCEEWIVGANNHSIETVYSMALEIEQSMAKSEAEKMLESLKIVFPEHDFTRCGDIVLGGFLSHPQTPEGTLRFAINKYLQMYNKNCLCNLLFRLVQTKKIKDHAMNVINNYEDGSLIRRFEARCCIHLCEQMISEKDVNFERYVKELLEKETPLCIDSLSISPYETGRVISEVVVRHLDNDKEFKLWYNLLNPKNIKVTSFLCVQYPELLKSLLKFFDNYAAEAEFQEGKSFSWSHKLIPLKDFVDILHFLLKNDGLVGVTVNDYLTQKLIDFKGNFTFWLDVKTLL